MAWIEADDELRLPVAGRGLGAEDEGARLDRLAPLGPEVEGHDVEGVEELALVLVQALDLAVEERGRVHLEAELVLDQRREGLLVPALDLEERGPELRLLDVGLELPEALEIGGPVRADLLGDQRGEAGVAGEDPAAGRDAVGLVVEALRVVLVEVAEQLVLDELAVELGHAVDRVRADHGEVRHPHPGARSPSSISDIRATWSPVRVLGHHLAEEAAVDLVDYLEVPGEEPLEDRDRPALEGLGQQRVVV